MDSPLSCSTSCLAYGFVELLREDLDAEDIAPSAASFGPSAQEASFGQFVPRADTVESRSWGLGVLSTEG
jgi:hypothetical protein